MFSGFGDDICGCTRHKLHLHLQQRTQSCSTHTTHKGANSLYKFKQAFLKHQQIYSRLQVYCINVFNNGK
jgi:hypothetical protein